MVEIWEKILSYPKYEISNYGRVRKLDTGRVKTIGLTRGYPSVRLMSDGGTSKIKYIHRFLAIAFIPNPENKPFVNHKDGNKSNNCLSNLEWCTSSENNQHAIDNKLRGYRIGHLHHFAVFSEKDVADIRALYNSGKKTAYLVKLYNRSRSAIENIIKGISYKQSAI